MIQKKIVIITGLSGSGKSTVARTLEDAGFFCIDNLPMELVPKLLELSKSSGGVLTHLALVIDSRQRSFLARYAEVLKTLELSGIRPEMVFLEARDDVLVRRYSETRRQHPLAATGSVLEGIAQERKELAGIKEKAHRVIDTSDMTVHHLREEIKKSYESHPGESLKIAVNSFGYGRGLPMESDLVFDVRFLPNPFFVDELKPKDGLDPEVKDWLESHAATQVFRAKLEEMLLFLLPLYIREGKQYLTISLGCTGGRHRSVVIAEHVGRFLEASGYTKVRITHRDIGR